MSASLRRVSVQVICAALILISAAAALVWLGLAGNIWLTDRVGPAAAALIVGLVLLVPLIALLVVHWISSGAEAAHDRAHIAHEEALRAAAEHDPGEAVTQVTDKVQTLFRERPLMALIMSLAAGAVIAKYPGAAKAMAKYMARN